MSAGKGPARRKGSNDKAYSEGYPNIKGFKSNEKEFEEKFMGKQASEEEEKPVSGKYFIKE